VVNEHEFELIFDRPLAPILFDDADKPDNFAGILVITLGSDGVVTLADNDRIRQPGQVVEVIDSTGAGDCFVGYLASALHDQADLASAITLANLAASISVTRPGAASSIPVSEEVIASG
jgi:ribokinase